MNAYKSIKVRDLPSHIGERVDLPGRNVDGILVRVSENTTPSVYIVIVASGSRVLHVVCHKLDEARLVLK
jgi:hypothetical protein